METKKQSGCMNARANETIGLTVLPKLNIAEGLLEIGVSPDRHRHFSALVLAINEQQIENVVSAV